MVQVAPQGTEHCEVSTAIAAAELRREVARLCEGEGLHAVVQPIVRLTDMVVVGYEALSRVEAGAEDRSIQWWLDAATEVGLRSQLEVACWRRIAELGPPPEERLLFANVSPATLFEPELAHLREVMPTRLVIEVTEQMPVDDYALLARPWNVPLDQITVPLCVLTRLSIAEKLVPTGRIEPLK